MTILYLTQDLFFSSRVTALARQVGVDVSVVGTVDQLRERLTKDSIDAVVVDLEHREAVPATILECMPSSSRPPMKIIAYGPHVKESLLEAARTAGFDLVLSRGQFDKQIAQLLPTLAPRS